MSGGDYTNAYQFYSTVGNMLFYMNSSSATQVGGDGYMNISAGNWTIINLQRGELIVVFSNGVLRKTTTLSGTAGNNSGNVFRLGVNELQWSNRMV